MDCIKSHGMIDNLHVNYGLKRQKNKLIPKRTKRTLDLEMEIRMLYVSYLQG